MILIAELINHSVNGIANMRKIKKAQAGDKLKATRIINKGSNVSSVKQDYSVDTSGYAAGKKKFPATKESTMERSGKKTQKNVNVRRSQVDKFIKNPSKTITQVRKYFKDGGDVKKAQSGDSLVYESKGVRYPKRRVAIDTAGYAGGKKSFKATSKYLEDLSGKPKEYAEKPKTYGRKVVKAILKTKGVTPKQKAGGSVKKKLVKK